jgi:hypothetical protein
MLLRPIPSPPAPHRESAGLRGKQPMGGDGLEPPTSCV